MNVITNFERRIEDDYYNILGCHDSASVSIAYRTFPYFIRPAGFIFFLSLMQSEQISAEYKHRALLCHPDKNQDDLSKIKFQKLQVNAQLLEHFLRIIKLIPNDTGS